MGSSNSHTIHRASSYKKKILFSLATAALLIVGSLVIPRNSEAVPAFARQTGFSCNTCHYQHFPLLNQFGRAFKAGGYTMTGGNQGLVEGDFLSIPAVLNAALITKTKYTKTNGDNNDSGTNKGKVDFPDDAALFLAGRVGEHIGFTLEVQLANPAEAAFSSFKLPITLYQLNNGTNFQIIPYTTDGAGAAFGFELLNTGAMMMMRPMESMMVASAQLFTVVDQGGEMGTMGMMPGAASGVAFVVNNPLWFINYSLWTPEQLGANSGAGPYLHYLRAAVTPQYKGWDFGAGFQWWGGTGKNPARDAPREKADSWALDLQAQGTIWRNLPLGVYLTYANAPKSGGDIQNIFNTRSNDRNAWNATAELGVIPGRLTLITSYIDGDNGKATASDERALTLGGTFLVAQNFELQLNHTIYSGSKFDSNPANGDQKTLLMLFAGF